MQDILDINVRKKIIQNIMAQENVERKSQSLRDTEVYNGNIEPYVYDRMFERGYSPSTMQQTPIVSTINTCKRVVDQTGSIYKEAPTRVFHNVSDEQAMELEETYESMWFDSKMATSNRYFKLQQQNHVIVLPKNDSLHMRVIKNHQLDVIPNHINPEIADIYILTGFDKSQSTLRQDDSENGGDGFNSDIADQDDYKKAMTRHVWWSKDYHFVTDGNGDILSAGDDIQVDNPIGMIPIVEISEDKDLVYFIQNESVDSRFCVQYNEALSNQNMVVLMQGFSQAVMLSPEELMPESITIGPTKILKLITKGDIEGDTDFKFVTPNADLDGVRAHTESLLAQYLSSKGIKPDTVTGQTSAQSATSGVERLLAMVEKFEASKQDIARYKQAERELFKVIKMWLGELGILQLPEDADVSVKFAEPTAILSEIEELDIIERRMDLGLMTKEQAYARLEDMSIEEAKDALNDIPETEINKERSQPEV